MINEKEIIEIISDLIKQDISTKLKEQGHNNTGSLLNSISYKITQTADSIITDFYMNNYGNIVDFGVRANRIPYRRGSGAKKSKYIDGLINYFQSKGLSDAESKRAAFATANVHKQDGMPTKASSRFSKTGERTGFITKVIDSDNPYNIMLHEFGLKIDTYIDDLINNLT
ncbi:MAG TPA: hypothetical protein PLJ53_07870 [Sedimentibacter sp.]|jgi:hypothetical protein|nr:hypothetical protein [Sedimentibacter sp.]